MKHTTFLAILIMCITIASSFSLSYQESSTVGDNWRCFPSSQSLILCSSGVECRETSSGPKCGSCPPGYYGDGRQCRHICDSHKPCAARPCRPSSSTPYYECEGCPKGFEWNGNFFLDLGSVIQLSDKT